MDFFRTKWENDGNQFPSQITRAWISVQRGDADL